MQCATKGTATFANKITAIAYTYYIRVVNCYLGIGVVKNIRLMISGYNLEMLDKHCTTMQLNVSYIL